MAMSAIFAATEVPTLNLLTNVSEILGETSTQLNITAFLGTEEASLRPAEVFAVILMSILIVVAFQGNLWIIIAIVVTSQLRSSMANIFVINLCAVDLLASILAMPLAVTTFVNGKNALEKEVCEVSGFFTTCVMLASMLSLCVISIERFYSIALPMHHAGHATPCLYLIVVFLVWVISLVIAVLPWMGVNSYSYRLPKRTCLFYWQGGSSADRAFIVVTFVVSFLIPSIILITMYVGIFRVARKAATSVAPHAGGITALPSVPDPGYAPVGNGALPNSNRKSNNVFTITTTAQLSTAVTAAPTINVEGASGQESDNNGHVQALVNSDRKCEISDTTSINAIDNNNEVKPSAINGKKSARDSVMCNRKRKHKSKLCVCNKVDIRIKILTTNSTSSTRISTSDNCQSSNQGGNADTKKRQSEQTPNVKPLATPHGGSRVTSSHIKAFKTLMIIVLSYLLLWGPFFICQIHGLVHEEAASRPIELLVTWLSFTSYAVNPCLYGCMNRMIREELSQLLKSAWHLCCCCSKGRSRCRRPCQKLSDTSGDKGYEEDGGEEEDDFCGAAESFYQFLQRTQASDVTAPVTMGNQGTTDMNSGNVSTEHQSNCVF